MGGRKAADPFSVTIIFNLQHFVESLKLIMEIK